MFNKEAKTGNKSSENEYMVMYFVFIGEVPTIARHLKNLKVRFSVRVVFLDRLHELHKIVARLFVVEGPREHFDVQCRQPDRQILESPAIS